MAMSRRKFVGGGLRLAGLAAGGALLAGCGDDEPEATPTATNGDEPTTEPTDGATTEPTSAPTTEPEPTEQMTEVTVTGAGAAAGFGYLMVNLGNYVEREGVSFELRTMSPTDALVAVFAGQVDIANAAFLGTARAFVENPQIRYLAPTFGGHTSVMTRLDGPDTMEELRGSRLGSLARASDAYNNLAVMLAEQGIDIEADYELTIGDAGVLEGLFNQGELDAFTAFEPIVTRLIHTDAAKEIIQYNEAWREVFGVSLPPATIATTTAWTDAVGPGVVQAIIEASARNVASFVGSLDRYMEHRDQWGLDDDAAIELLASRMDPLFTPEMTDEVRNTYEVFQEVALEHGLLENAVDLDELIWTP